VWVYGSSHSGSDLVLFGWRTDEPGPRWLLRCPHTSWKSRRGAIFLTPEGDRLWVFVDHSVVEYEAHTGRELSCFRIPYGSHCESGVVLRDGQTLLGSVIWLDQTGYDYECYLRRWSGVTGRVEWEKRIGLFEEEVILSSDERWLLRKCYEDLVLHDVESGEAIDTVSLALDSLVSLSLSPDERRLAVGTDRGVVLIFTLDLEALRQAGDAGAR
jgi:hypothetical protein